MPVQRKQEIRGIYSRRSFSSCTVCNRLGNQAHDAHISIWWHRDDYTPCCTRANCHVHVSAVQHSTLLERQGGKARISTREKEIEGQTGYVRMAAAVCVPAAPAGSSSNPPSPMSWDAPASQQLIQLLSSPPPLLAPPRFSAVPPPHALPRPKPLYPSSTLSGSESWSLQSVPSIEPPPLRRKNSAARTAHPAPPQALSTAATAGSTRTPPSRAPHSLGRAMATTRRLPPSCKPSARRDLGVIGRMQAVDNLRAHSELCHTPATRNNCFGKTPAVTGNNDSSRECRSYTFQDLSLWDQDEFEDCGFVPTSLRDFRNGYGADEWSKRPPARKRTSMRQLIRNQGHKSNAKLRWLRGQDSFDNEFDCPPESAGPISWGRALPRLFPRIRRR
jgi:hypothetical protein